jgi:hypothetical protein
MIYLSIGTIKNLVARDMDDDELEFYAACLRAVTANYLTEVPEWLNSKQKELAREITERVRANKEKTLKMLKARRESLKTPDEKRAALDASIKALEQELG